MGELGGLHALSSAEVLAARKRLVGSRNWVVKMHLTAMGRWILSDVKCFPALGVTSPLLKRVRMASSEEKERMWLEMSWLSQGLPWISESMLLTQDLGWPRAAQAISSCFCLTRWMQG